MKNLVILLVAMSGLALQSCKKENVSPSNSTGSSGAMRVAMTDAPGNYSSLAVQIVKIEAYLDQKGWVTLNNQSQIVQVLDLTNGAQTTISSSTGLEAGLYTKLKLTFGNENKLGIRATSGESFADVTFASEISKEVIIEVNQQVTAGATAEILLDFNVAESIVEGFNQFIIQPAITEIEDRFTGVKGDVQGAVQASIMLSNGQNTYTTYINASGEFLFRGVEEGTYQMVIQGIREGENLVRETTVPNIIVAKGEIRSTGNIQL